MSDQETVIKIKCSDCSGSYTLNHMKRHQSSMKHQRATGALAEKEKPSKEQIKAERIRKLNEKTKQFLEKREIEEWKG